MKIDQRIAALVGLIIITCCVTVSIAEQVQVQTSFTCSSNAECKKKCEALGPDHTWKPNPGGSTFGTCTKKAQSLTGGAEIGLATSWNLTMIGLALDILGFGLVFLFGGFTFGQSGLLLENDQSGKTKSLRIFGAVLIIAGFSLQLLGAIAH